ncbi:MAG: hypothetical protein NUV34_02190 [Sulfuricaulis sp.]|nr:hypothetical protein [Sulfuricaulis sp.]
MNVVIKMNTVEEQRRQWRREHRVGTPSLIRLDKEVRSFIDTLTPRMPYKAVARACLERFGEERAPTWRQIARYWEGRIERGEVLPRCSLRKSKVELDTAVKTFVDETLPEMGFVALAQACRDVFGPGRAPSKSALHRYWLKRKRTTTHDSAR